MQALAFAKSKDFKDAFVGNTAEPFSDTLYNASPQKPEVNTAYELNNKRLRVPHVELSRDSLWPRQSCQDGTDLPDGDARLAWKNLMQRYAPQGSSDLIHLSGEFNNCVAT